ncbi:unnamed protein product, partial [Amoebophrya sp. A25]
FHVTNVPSNATRLLFANAMRQGLQSGKIKRLLAGGGTAGLLEAVEGTDTTTAVDDTTLKKKKRVTQPTKDLQVSFTYSALANASAAMADEGWCAFRVSVIIPGDGAGGALALLKSAGAASTVRAIEEIGGGSENRCNRRAGKKLSAPREEELRICLENTESTLPVSLRGTPALILRDLDDQLSVLAVGDGIKSKASLQYRPVFPACLGQSKL